MHTIWSVGHFPVTHISAWYYVRLSLDCLAHRQRAFTQQKKWIFHDVIWVRGRGKEHGWERGQYPTSFSTNSRIKLQSPPSAKTFFCRSLKVLSTLGAVIKLNWCYTSGVQSFPNNFLQAEVKNSLKHCENRPWVTRKFYWNSVLL